MNRVVALGQKKRHLIRLDRTIRTYGKKEPYPNHEATGSCFVGNVGNGDDTQTKLGPGLCIE